MYYTRLRYDKTPTCITHCQNLDHLKHAIEQRRLELAIRKGLVIHHDHARPANSLITREKLREREEEVSSPPPYNPGIAPSEYHLLLSMKSALSSVELTSKEARKKYYLNSSRIKRGDSTRGNKKFVCRWKRIIQ